MSERSLIEKLAYRLQNAAYSHGQTDADDRFSDRKYRESADKSDAALTVLLTQVKDLKAGLESCAEHLEMALSRLGCPTEGNDGGSHGHDADDMGGINALENARNLLKQ